MTYAEREARALFELAIATVGDKSASPEDLASAKARLTPATPKERDPCRLNACELDVAYAVNSKELGMAEERDCYDLRDLAHSAQAFADQCRDEYVASLMTYPGPIAAMPLPRCRRCARLDDPDIEDTLDWIEAGRPEVDNDAT